MTSLIVKSLFKIKHRLKLWSFGVVLNSSLLAKSKVQYIEWRILPKVHMYMVQINGGGLTDKTPGLNTNGSTN